MNKAKVARRRARNFKASRRPLADDLTSATMERNRSTPSSAKIDDSATSRLAYSVNSNADLRSTTTGIPPEAPTPMEQLEYAAHRYSDLYEFAPTGYVSFTRSGRIMEINMASEELIGLPRERLIGMPFAVFVCREDSGLFLRHLLRCRWSDPRVETEVRLRNSARELIPVHLVSTPTNALSHGGELLFQTSIIDLRERKQFEDSIQRSEKRYRTLFDLVPVAIYVCDAAGTIREYNQRAVELWGREAGPDGDEPKYCGSYKIYYPDGRPMSPEQCPTARALRG